MMIRYILSCMTIGLIGVSIARADPPLVTVTDSAERVVDKKNTVPSFETAAKLPEHWRGSIMYGEKELQWLREGVKAHDLNIPLDILLPGVFSKDMQKKSLSTAQGLEKAASPIAKKDDIAPIPLPDETLFVYLNSIIYRNKKDWILWLGNKKLSPDDKDPLLEIAEVSSDHIVILWRNFPLDKIPLAWKEILVPLKNPAILTNGENIVLQSETKSIAVLLKPNQTFAGTQLDVVEGKLTAKQLAMGTAKPPTLPSPDAKPVESKVEVPAVVPPPAANLDRHARALYNKDRYQGQLDSLVHFIQ